MVDKKSKALLSGTIIYAIGTFGTKMLYFLIVPLYTYYIEPADLGEYDLLVTTVSMLSPLLTMKIADATYRWIINKEENEVPCISVTYLVMIRNCMIAVFLLLFINRFFPIWHCYYFIVILIGDRCLECLQKLLRGLKNQKLFAISGLFHTAIFVGLNLVKVCILKEGVTALMQSSVISLYSSIILILLLERRLRKIDLRQDYGSLRKELLRYSIPLVPTSMSWWIMSTSDRYVIRWALGVAVNGIYSVVYKFPSIMTMFFTMFNNSWTDLALAQIDDKEEAKKYVRNTFQKMYILAFTAIYVLTPLTKVVMQVILNVRYKEAAIYVGFLYLGTVFSGLSAFCQVGYFKGMKTKGAAISGFWGAAVNLTINILLIRLIGLHAATISTFLGYFVMWLINIHDIKDYFPVEIEWKLFLPLLSMGILLAIISTKTPIVVDLIIFIFAAALFIVCNRKQMIWIFQFLLRKLRSKT